MFGSLDISTSALVAHRQWLTVIANNMANQNTQFNAAGEYAPYRRQIPVFAQGADSDGNLPGVHLQEIKLDDSPFRREYDPDSELADADGYVYYPNVDPVIEQMNAMVAARAYEANVTAAEATKSMMLTSLRLLA